MGPVNGSSVRTVFIIGLSQSATGRETAKLLAPYFRVEEIPDFRWDPGVPSFCDVSIDALRAHLARSPTPGEVGCALAHQSAYMRLLASSDGSAIILENDARIDDLDTFLTAVALAASAVAGRGLVASLYAGSQVASWFPPEGGIQVTTLPFRPSYALAYVLDRAAARWLTAANTPICHVADWPGPPRPGDFRFIANAGISPDNSRVSTVNPTMISRQPSPFARAQIISGVWWLRHQTHFGGFRSYWAMMIRPRFTFRREQAKRWCAGLSRRACHFV